MLSLHELNVKLQTKSFNDIFAENLLKISLDTMNRTMRELSKINYDQLTPGERDAYDNLYSTCESFRDTLVRGETFLSPSAIFEITRIVPISKFKVNPFLEPYESARQVRDRQIHQDLDRHSERELLEFYKSRLEVHGTAEKTREVDGVAFIALEEYLTNRIGKDVQLWLSQ